MDSQKAQNFIEQQKSTLKDWVIARCDNEKHLVPLALLYVNKRLSENNWLQVCQYDGKQPFADFLKGLVEDAMETFFHGVWFGNCANIIGYWLNYYKVTSISKRQDAADYVKNKLTRDNFARFRSYNKSKQASFTTYITVVIRNLLVDYLRKKTPLTEMETLQDGDKYDNESTADDTGNSYRQQHLDEIGHWFFAEFLPEEKSQNPPASLEIPEKIKLNPKERLFLRAMYKEGMTVEEAGGLPGINMGKWQAHGYHRRLKRRIKKLLDSMGYENLQSLLYSG